MSTKIQIIDFFKLVLNTFRHYTIFIFERTFVPSHARTPGDTYMWMFCPNSHKHFPDCSLSMCCSVGCGYCQAVESVEGEQGCAFFIDPDSTANPPLKEWVGHKANLFKFLNYCLEGAIRRDDTTVIVFTSRHHEEILDQVIICNSDDIIKIIKFLFAWGFNNTFKS